MNNGQVTRVAAQGASCLSQADFERHFYTVEAALGDSKTRGRVRLSFESLVRQHRIPISTARLAPWLEKAEEILLDVDSRYESQGDEVKCAIFYWACTSIKVCVLYSILSTRPITTISQKDMLDMQDFSDNHGIPRQTLRVIVNLLKEHCSILMAKISEAADNSRSPSKRAGISSPRKSPSKPALRALPSNDSPQKRRVLHPESEMDEMDMLPPQSPTKKRKTDVFPQLSPTLKLDTFAADHISDMGPSSTLRPPQSHRQPHSPPHSARDVINAMDVDDSPLFPNDSGSDEPPRPRKRFRPVFLDQKQWNLRDPRLDRLLRQGKKHKEKMAELYGHPFEQYRLIGEA